MIERRLAAVWASDAAEPDVRGLAAQLARLLGALAVEHASLGPFELRGADRRRVPATATALEAALAARRRTERDERLGELSGHEVACHVYGRFAPSADFRATVGVRHEGTRETWAPNRVVLTVRETALALGELGRALRALVEVTSPLWAFADGGAGMFGGRSPNGEPQVGWITYLHRGYGRPRDLEDGTSVRRFGDGRIVAFERLPDDPDERGARVAALEKALLRAGVLRPYAAFCREPHAFDADEVPEPRAAPEPEKPARASLEPDAALGSTAVAPARAAVAATPFKRGDFRPPRALEPSARLGGTAPAAAPSGRDKATPFDKPAFPVDRYAALCAELDAWPGDRPATLARHGLADEAALAALHLEYRAAFERYPGLHGRWGGLYVRHKDALVRGR
ncbi:MAG: hypothetical protein IT373_28530 [Polyangiaceae bacterium]|nr:hypothetical protein [Polyangiaceae bacterium]